MNFLSRRVFYRIFAVGLVAKTTTIAATEPSTPTYHDGVADIFAAHCIECHQPEGIGPFSLQNYTQVRRRARQIIEVTESGFMPPWKPAAGFGPALVGERRISATELSVLQRWFDAGAPAGDLTASPTQPKATGGWSLGEPDLILELAEPYLLPKEGRDIYRNVVLPFPLATSHFVKAIEIKPGPPQAVHHALLMLDTTGRAQQRDEAESGVGYDGMGVGSADPPAGHIIGWTPGQTPHESHPGTAWKISAETDLVLQLHLLPTGKPERIKPRLGFYFTDEAPTRPSLVIQLRNFDIEIPAGKSDYRVRESITLPAPLEVLGLYPHAHYIAKDLKIFATLPNGERQWLLRIPDWDFNWQGDYRFQEPLSLPAGTTLQMDYTYDNSDANPRNPSSPAVDVSGGWGARDEMAEAMIQVIPEKTDDLALLQKAQVDYDIAQAGGEARYHYFNGAYLEQQKEWRQAAAAYERALRLDPTFASARFKLGVITEQAGDLTAAEFHYQKALVLQPELIPARLALAKLRFRRGDSESARAIFISVQNENPTHLDALLALTRFYQAVGNFNAALALLRSGETNFETSPQFQLEFAETLWGRSRTDAALRRFEKAAQIAEESSHGSEIFRAALLRMAEIYENRGDFIQANQAITEALTLPTDKLDALLLATNISLQLEDDQEALNYLKNLVDRPAATTFAPLDILANLSTPNGSVLLVDAYLQSGNLEDARTVIDHALPMLIERGLKAPAAQIRERRDQLSQPSAN
ncbi:MAG: hypothetical protein SynsKO_13170 [Synoicihabitans sp.]